MKEKINIGEFIGSNITLPANCDLFFEGDNIELFIDSDKVGVNNTLGEWNSGSLLNELRIGNWVLVPNAGSLNREITAKAKIVDDGWSGFAFSANPNNKSALLSGVEIMPIEITKEILLKIGAVQYEYNFYKLHDCTIALFTNGAILLQNDSIVLVGKYLHQLQNIWKIIFDNELEIEL